MFDVMIMWTVAIAEDRLVPESHPYRVRALSLDPGNSLTETLARKVEWTGDLGSCHSHENVGGFVDATAR